MIKFPLLTLSFLTTLRLSAADDGDLINNYFNALNDINARIEKAVIDPNVKTFADLEANLGLLVHIDGVRVLAGWIPYPGSFSGDKLIARVSVMANGWPLGGVYIGMSYNGKNINDDAFVYNHKSEIEIDKTAYGYITGTITVMYDGKDRKATPRKDDERVKLKP